MPSLTSHGKFAQAILDHVQTGAYPEEEDVVSAELSATGLPVVIKLIEQSRQDLEKQVQRRSQDAAPDIDGWITQAKQLRNDVQGLHQESHQIVEDAAHGNSLEENVHDADSQIRLLNEELTFSHEIQASLTRLQAIRQNLDNIQQAILEDRLPEATIQIRDVEAQGLLQASPSASRISTVFSARCSELRNDIATRLTRSWNRSIVVARAASAITIRHSEEAPPILDLDSTARSLKMLNMFDQALGPFCEAIDQLLISPRLDIRSDGSVGTLEIENETISCFARSTDLSAEALFSELQSLVEFLQVRLPPTISDHLANSLVPHLTSRIVATWLTAAVPDDLEGIQSFQDTVDRAQGFGDFLESARWPGKSDIDQWVGQIPNLWIRKRQESCLGKVRRLLSQGLRSTKIVERSETQILPGDDEVFAAKGGVDDWNAGWSDEEDATSSKVNKSAKEGTKDTSDDEEDVGAWGLDAGQPERMATEDQKHVSNDDDGAEAWGWGDEDDGDSPTSTRSRLGQDPPSSSKTKDLSISKPAAEREITLRETYTISNLPQEILDIIVNLISESESLQTSTFRESPISSSASSLLSLPGLLLTLYRAGSANAYHADLSGNMYLYNDCLWLAEQMRDISSEPAKFTRRKASGQFEAHAAALEGHGKRSYAREMESQRTIVTDLMDGAQGFMQCTEPPFNQECETAIASAIDRLRQLNLDWKGVISHSALLQSLGSLLSTVCSKLIIDIEDMSDISEPESQQLAGYCSRLAALEDLFTPQQGHGKAPNGGDVLPLTAVYTSSWLKFQYLANILESSLVDIKYLWTKGELGLEFKTEELVDLVVALFADSPHRRTAIGEIRAAGRRR